MIAIRPFEARGPTVNMAVGTSSSFATISVPGNGQQSLRLVNSGTNTIFVRLVDDSSLLASATTSIPMLPNTVETFYIKREVIYVAAIAGATGNTLYITTGESA